MINMKLDYRQLKVMKTSDQEFKHQLMTILITIVHFNS